MRAFTISLFAMSLSLVLVGCQATLPVAHLIICDGTGPEGSQEACSEAYLKAGLEVWLTEADTAEGGSFTVVPTSGSYASTATIRIPWRALEGGHQGQAREQRRRLYEEVLEDIEIPGDESEPKTNRSDLTAALSVVMQEIAVLKREGSTVSLAIASDGRIVIDGVLSAEKGPPPSSEKLLSQMPEGLRLEGVAVRWCGFSARSANPAWSASDQVALEAAWEETLRELGAQPKVARSCHVSEGPHR